MDTLCILEIDPGKWATDSLLSCYKKMLLLVMQAIAGRFKQNPGYGWIDTKINIITGQDFDPDDLVKGKNSIYGWIQGRALEAIASHCRWMKKHWPDETRVQNLENELRIILESVLGNLQKIRNKNSGHLFFFFDKDGNTFTINNTGKREPANLSPDSSYNFSDLFGAKGMYAAAQYLGNESMIRETSKYCLDVLNSLFEDRFQSDQVPLDPKNPVVPVKGRYSHGPKMIAIGMACSLVQEKQEEGLRFGKQLINHILDHYVNINDRWPDLAEYDFVEFINERNEPYRQNDMILSDSGHSLEFVGLSLKFINNAIAAFGRSAFELSEVSGIREKLVNIVLRNFENGFSEKGGGICKLFDLKTRKPVNTDMPWWPLPETIRAGWLAYCCSEKDNERNKCLDIVRKCHNSFVKYYIRPQCHYFAIQTIDINGEPSNAIPATSDADPGYHTGCSLIDCFEPIEEFGRRLM